MKKSFPLISFLILAGVYLPAQVSFEDSKALFDHPKSGDSNVDFAFIPFDYNDDGITDFVGQSSTEQWLYKGIDETTYEIIELPADDVASREVLTTVDLDGDDDLDILTARRIYINNGSDTFTPYGDDLTGNNRYQAVGGIDKDGNIDLISIDGSVSSDYSLHIHYNDGDANFTSSMISIPKLDRIVVGDIDQDDDIDIIGMYPTGSPEVIILQNNNQVFSPIVIDFFLTENDGRIGELYDFDQDGDLDILTSSLFDGLYIMENTDAYQTEPEVIEIASFDDIYVAKTADFNQDGLQDIVVATVTVSTLSVRVMLGEGGFNFSDPILIESFIGVGGLIGFSEPDAAYFSNILNVYDFDEDGKVDIIYKDGDDPSKIYLFRNNKIINSVNELESDPLVISPNPVSDVLYLNNPDVLGSTYSILSSNGAILQNGILTEDSISITTLPSGIYILSLVSNDTGMIPSAATFIVR